LENFSVKAKAKGINAAATNNHQGNTLASNPVKSASKRLPSTARIGRNFILAKAKLRAMV
jgi:hypothetical protein